MQIVQNPFPWKILSMVWFTNPTQNTELQSCNIPKGYISKKVPIKFSEVLAEYLSKRQAYSSGFLEIHATKKKSLSPQYNKILNFLLFP